jgi:hypothetical protein
MMPRLRGDGRKRRLRPGEVLVRSLHGKETRRTIGRLEEVYLLYDEGEPNVGFARFDRDGGSLVPVRVEEI